MQDEFYHILAVSLQNVLVKSNINRSFLQELRLRVGRPLLLRLRDKEYFLTKEGGLTLRPEDGIVVTADVLKETMEYVSRYSLYAYGEELRQGFLTVRGGHRIGFSGQMMKEREGAGKITHIQFINIRVAHEIRDCALPLLPFVYDQKKFLNTLLVSAPGGGKTTMLRDLIRLLSDGNSYGTGQTIGVVDERSELGACHMGAPQNDLGLRTDILDGCKKAEGMIVLVRSMAPKIIAVDELGSREDVEALSFAATCGVGVLASVHGNGYEEVEAKPAFAPLLQQGLFKRIVVLVSEPKAGTIAAVLDGKGEQIWKPDYLEVC